MNVIVGDVLFYELEKSISELMHVWVDDGLGYACSYCHKRSNSCIYTSILHDEKCQGQKLIADLGRAMDNTRHLRSKHGSVQI